MLLCTAQFRTYCYTGLTDLATTFVIGLLTIAVIALLKARNGRRDTIMLAWQRS